MKLVKELKKKNKYNNLDPSILQDMLDFVSDNTYTDYTMHDIMRFARQKYKQDIDYDILRNHFHYLRYKTKQIRVSRSVRYNITSLNMYCLNNKKEND